LKSRKISVVLTGRLQDRFSFRLHCIRSCATWGEKGILELCHTLNFKTVPFVF